MLGLVTSHSIFTYITLYVVAVLGCYDLLQFAPSVWLFIVATIPMNALNFLLKKHVTVGNHLQ